MLEFCLHYIVRTLTLHLNHIHVDLLILNTLITYKPDSDFCSKCCSYHVEDLYFSGWCRKIFIPVSNGGPSAECDCILWPYCGLFWALILFEYVHRARKTIKKKKFSHIDKYNPAAEFPSWFSFKIKALCSSFRPSNDNRMVSFWERVNEMEIINILRYSLLLYLFSWFFL